MTTGHYSNNFKKYSYCNLNLPNDTYLRQARARGLNSSLMFSQN